MSTLRFVPTGVVLLVALLLTPRPGAALAVPPVFLNHFFVVISPESYAAVLADPYLKTTFAPFEKRTTARNDQTYTGAYWYGRKTYFEVFEPPSQGPLGTSGIAFTVDGVGESAAVKAAWTESLGAAQSFPVTRRTETAEPAWFDMTAARGYGSGLRLWLMEYHRDFLASWYPELTPARGTTRAEALDRYVAKIGRGLDRDTTVLRDITRLVLALDDTNRDTLRRHVLPAGWSVSPSSGDDPILFTGPDGIVLEVRKAQGAVSGIIEARFSVQGAPRPHSATLGQVRLDVDSSSARIRFTP
jgi:Family of unknown function (DUF5829)